MAIWGNTRSATYVAVNQFTVSGDHTNDYPEGLRVRVDCSGWVYSSVSSASYGGVNTTVTITSNVLTDPCGNVEDGNVLSGSQGNLPVHTHDNDSEGGSDVTGTAPAHEISGSQIRFKNPDDSWGAWINISGIDIEAGDAYKLIQVKSDESGYEHTEYPQIDNLKIGSLDGILRGDGGSVLDESSLKHLGDVGDAVTDSGAQGDILVRGASEYGRQAIGTKYQNVRVNSAGTGLEWANDKIITGTAGTFVSQYDLLYSDSTDSGDWKLADADNSSTASAWGVSIQSGGMVADGDPVDVQLFGIIENESWSWTPGAKLYVSSTAGDFTESENDYHVAYAITATKIFFLPGAGGGSGGGNVTADVTAGEAVNNYRVVFVNKDDSGEVWYADNTNTDRDYVRGLGIVTGGAIGDGSTGEVTFKGVVTNVGWSWTPGKFLYLTTSGNMTHSPTLPDISGSPWGYFVCVGFAITATTIMFDPRPDGIDWWSDGKIGKDPVVGGTYSYMVTTAGENLSVGDCVYIDRTLGRLYKAINNGTEEAADAVGIVIEPGGITSLYDGDIRYFGPVHNSSWSWDKGKWVYVSDTAGSLTQTMPTTLGRWVKPVGWALDARTIIVAPQLGWQVSPSVYDVGGCTPDYKPPDFIWKDVDEVSFPAARIFMAGHRSGGQYQNTSDFAYYRDIEAQDLDVDGAMVGGDVVSSWYSIFMLYDGSFLVLPYIRVDAIAFASGQTTINPADHADGTTANNNFVSANDVFNDYRLQYISMDTNNGTVYTIADSADGTPDQIKITGDITSVVSAMDWLQMIPKASDKYVYLGDVPFDGSGNLVQIYKKGWKFSYANSTTPITGNCATGAANTDLGLKVPPTATEVKFYINVEGSGTNIYLVQANIYSGTSGTDQCNEARTQMNVAGHTHMNMKWPMTIPLTAVASVRNIMAKYDGSLQAANNGYFHIVGWEE